MSVEERVLRLENAYTTLAELLAHAESRTNVLLQLARSADERLETQQGWINQLGEAQANSEKKIEALADAQIKTEAALAELSATVTRFIEGRTGSSNV
jgi:predicted  nucleic acid-binding Zn-ribbon protein